MMHSKGLPSSVQPSGYKIYFVAKSILAQFPALLFISSMALNKLFIILNIPKKIFIYKMYINVISLYSVFMRIT